MNNQVNVNLAFTADIKSAQATINQLKTSLNQIASTPVFNGGQLTKDMQMAVDSAKSLQTHLSNAFNVKTGNFDLNKLNMSLKQSGQSISTLGNNLLKAGRAGEQAFMSVNSALSNANLQLNKSNSLIAKFGQTLKNTLSWQLSSTFIHALYGSIQKAFTYAQDLNQSLNNIRIVTGNSVDQMRKFADAANKAAKSLSTTTTAYTDASLIYFQQGLSEAEVKKRADVTIKMANVTGQAVEEVSNQMTAVWNNFAKHGEDLESFADKMTALGAATASSSDEIANGLEKFAALGETIGLSFDYAAAALATITAETRQSEEVVGTALKTIFARIQGLKLGETLDDGTSLNKYSQALKTVGIDIFNQAGELKNMDNILSEMGNKWDTLSKAQQMALAQTVAGTRQYTQLVALMDNWEDMEMNLNITASADGTLQQQAEIYEESWEASKKRIKASMEGLYNELIPEEAIIDITDGFAKVINSITSIIDAAGGFKTILLGISSIVLTKFQPALTNTLNEAFLKLESFTPAINKITNSIMHPIQSLKSAFTGFNVKDSFLAMGAKSQIRADSSYERTGKIVSEDSLAGQSTLYKSLTQTVPVSKQVNNELMQGVQLTNQMSDSFQNYTLNMSKVNNLQQEIVNNSRYISKADQEKLNYMQQQNVAAAEELEKEQNTLRIMQEQMSLMSSRPANLQNQQIYTQRDDTTFIQSGIFSTEQNRNSMNNIYSSFGMNYGATYGQNGMLVSSTATAGGADFTQQLVDQTASAQQLQQYYSQISTTVATISQTNSSSLEVDQKKVQATQEIENLFNHIKNLSETTTGKELSESLKDSSTDANQLLNILRRLQGELGNAARGLGISEKTLNDINSQAEQIAGQQGNVISKQNAWNSSINNTRNYLNQTLQSYSSMGGVISGFLSGFSQVAMGINMVSSAFQTLKDDTASLGQKLMSVSMAGVMGFRALTTVIQGISFSYQAITAAVAANNALKIRGLTLDSKSLTVAQAEALLEGRVSKEQKEQITLELFKKSIADKKLDSYATLLLIENLLTEEERKQFDTEMRKMAFNGQELTGDQMELMIEKLITDEEKKQLIYSKLKTQHGTGGSVNVKDFNGLAGKNSPFNQAGLFKKIGGLALIAAGVTAITLTFKSIDKLYNKAENEAKKATEVAGEAAKMYQSVSKSHEDFLNGLQGYEEAQDKLKGLVRGTKEYEEALLAANEQAMAILETNNDLDYRIGPDGSIIIDEKVLKEAEEESLQRKKEFQQDSIAANLRAKEASANADMIDFNRKELGGIGGEQVGGALGGLAGGAGGGALIGAGIGSIVPVIGTAVGAAVGAVVGAIGGLIGGIIKTSDGSSTDSEESAMQVLAQQYKNYNGQGFETKESFENMINTLVEQGKIEESLKNELINNYSATKELASEMAKISNQKDSFYEGVVQEIMGEEIEQQSFSNSENEAFNTMVGKKLQGRADAYLEQGIYKDAKGNLISGDKELAKEFAKENGWNENHIDIKDGKVTFYDSKGNIVQDSMSMDTVKGHFSEQAARMDFQENDFIANLYGRTVKKLTTDEFDLTNLVGGESGDLSNLTADQLAKFANAQDIIDQLGLTSQDIYSMGYKDIDEFIRLVTEDLERANSAFNEEEMTKDMDEESASNFQSEFKFSDDADDKGPVDLSGYESSTIQGLATAYKNIFEIGGIEAQNAANAVVESIQESDVDEEVKEEAIKKFNQVDFSDLDSVEEFQNWLNANGFDMSVVVDELSNTTDASKEFDLSQIRNEIASIMNYKDVKTNQVVDETAYNDITENGTKNTELFTMNEKGQWVMTADQMVYDQVVGNMLKNTEGIQAALDNQRQDANDAAQVKADENTVNYVAENPLLNYFQGKDEDGREYGIYMPEGSTAPRDNYTQEQLGMLYEYVHSDGVQNALGDQGYWDPESSALTEDNWLALNFLANGGYLKKLDDGTYDLSGYDKHDFDIVNGHVNQAINSVNEVSAGVNQDGEIINQDEILTEEEAAANKANRIESWQTGNGYLLQGQSYAAESTLSDKVDLFEQYGDYANVEQFYDSFNLLKAEYPELRDEVDAFTEEMRANGDVCDKTSQAYRNLDKALKQQKIVKNAEALRETLKEMKQFKFTNVATGDLQKFNELVKKIQTQLKEIYGLNLSEDFIKNNQIDIEKLFTGGEGSGAAYDRLMFGSGQAQQQIGTAFNIDTTGITDVQGAVDALTGLEGKTITLTVEGESFGIGQMTEGMKQFEGTAVEAAMAMAALEQTGIVSNVQGLDEFYAALLDWQKAAAELAEKGGDDPELTAKVQEKAAILEQKAGEITFGSGDTTSTGSTLGGGGGGGGKDESKTNAEYLQDKVLSTYEKKRQRSQKLREGMAPDKAGKYIQQEIDLLEKEQKILEKQIKTWQKLLKQKVQEFESKHPGFDIVLTDEGEIANISALWEQISEIYNQKVQEEGQNSADRWMDSIKNELEDVTGLQEKIDSNVDSIADKEKEQAELALQEITERIEWELKKIDYEIDKLNYYQEKALAQAHGNKQTIEAMFENFAYQEQEMLALFEKGGILRQGIDELNAAAAMYPDYAQMFQEQILEYQGQLIDLNMDIIALRNEIEDLVQNVLDAAKDEIDTQIGRLDTYTSMLEHLNTIIDLSGRAMINTGLKAQLGAMKIDNMIGKMSNLKIQMEGMIQASQAAEAALADRRAVNDEQSVKFWENQVQILKQEAEAASEDFLASWEETLSAAEELFTLRVEMAVNTLSSALTPFSSLEVFQSAYTEAKTLQEQYLDDATKVYELNKLNRQLNLAITDENDLLAKSKLRDIQAEIYALQAKGTEMSQYDLDILQKKYDLQLAEIALLEAQNSKTSMRLVRDASGNWNYVYDADEEKIEDATQKYEDALYELDKVSVEYLSEISEQLIENQIEYKDALMDLDKNAVDYQAQLLRLQEYYTKRQTYLLDELNKGAIQSGKNFHDTLYGQIADVQDYQEAFKTFEDNSDLTISELTKNYKDWQETVELAMNTAGTSWDNFGVDVGNTLDGLEDHLKALINEISTLVKVLMAYVNQSVDMVTGWQQKYSFAVEGEIAKNEEYINRDYVGANYGMTANAQKMSDSIFASGPGLNYDASKDVAYKYTGGANPTGSKKTNLEVWRTNRQFEQEYKDYLAAKKRIDNGQADKWDYLIVSNANKTFVPQTQSNKTNTNTEFTGDEFSDYKPTDQELKDAYSPRKNFCLEWVVNVREAAGDKNITSAKDATAKCNDAIEYKPGMDLPPGTIVLTHGGSGHGHAEIVGLDGNLYGTDNGTSSNIISVSTLDDKNWNNLYVILPPDEATGNQAAWIAQDVDHQKELIGYDTGGYTGDWNSPEGRLALLHEKEIVLNKEDTKNILDVVSMVRNMGNVNKIIDNKVASLLNSTNNILSNLLSQVNIAPYDPYELQQNVEIYAEFPNATDQNEIREALSNLTNEASQYLGVGKNI